MSEKHNIPHRHLRKYISGLTCQACLPSLGHRQYRYLKSTVSSSKQLAVNSRDLAGNLSKFEISTLVPTADTMFLSAALFNDLLDSKHADTPISILSFPTQAELSRARVKQKQVALDTLHWHGSAADDPGIVKLKAYKQELDEFIEMAEAIDTQPFEGITTFQQAHELRADQWADATSLAWDGSRYYLMLVEKNTEYYAASTSKDRSVTGTVSMLEDWITETGHVPCTLRLDGAKEFVGSEMRDFCRKHNIKLQLVPAYNHLLQCRVEVVIRIIKSHTRVALKQSGCPLRFRARTTKDFIKKINTLWARKEADGTVTTAFERMQPVGVCNNRLAIAVPFECKVIVQIPRESSLCTDGSHGDRAMEGIYVGADDSTSSMHVHLFKTSKTELFADCKAFPDKFPFLDPDVLFDKSIFSAKYARRMHQKDDAEEKDFIAAITRSHRHATAPSETDSQATSKNRERSAVTEPVAKRPAAVRQVMYTKCKDMPLDHPRAALPELVMCQALIHHKIIFPAPSSWFPGVPTTLDGLCVFAPHVHIKLEKAEPCCFVS